MGEPVRGPPPGGVLRDNGVSLRVKGRGGGDLRAARPV